MALQIANKINRQALQNIRKSLCSGCSESTCFPRFSSNDASSVASTITSTCSTIHTNNSKTNVPTPNITVAPPTTPVPNPPPSATSIQCSPYSNQNQTSNTPITIVTDEFPSQHLFDKESNATRLMPNCPPQLPSLSTAYQVCPLRQNLTSKNYMRTPINQFNQASYNKTVKVVNQPVNTAYLQPGKQPHIYIPRNNGASTPQASVEALREAVEQGGSYKGMREPPASETNGGYRTFQESMTYRNLTQPLKFSRLASPFPEPVKEMPSHKITDQEKSTQMFAESRANAMAQAHFVQRQKQLKLKPQIPIQPSFARHYSDRAFGKPQGFTMPHFDNKFKKRSVKKIKTDKPCPPVNKSTMCKDNMYVFKPCTKKQAPYPSYSEFCHEDRPFVCRSCPWVSDIHPAFQPKKKNYHTASRAMSMASSLTTSLEGNSGGSSHDINDVNSISDDGNDSIITMELKKRNMRKKPDCKPDTLQQRIPCAWVELDKKEDMERSNPPKRKKRKQSKVDKKEMPPVKPTDICKTAGYKSEITQQMNDMIIDASKKGPHEHKSQMRCPSKTDENSPTDKRKCTKIPTPSTQPEKEEATSNHYFYKCEHPSQIRGLYIPHDVATPAVGQSIDEWLAGLRPNKMETHSNVVTSGGPCIKFPFKPFAFDLVINRKSKMRGGKCPKKPKKPLTVDCPQRPERSDQLAQLFNDMLLSKKYPDEKKCPKDDFKCPVKTPKSPNKNSGKPKSPPCKNKRKPESQICPDDLLTRRRKDKPWKRAISNGGDFEKAISMLNSIQKTRSAPSLFIPYNFRQK